MFSKKSSCSKNSSNLSDGEDDFSENVQTLEERYLKNEGIKKNFLILSLSLISEEKHKRCLDILEQQIKLLGEENLNLRTTLFDLEEARERKKAQQDCEIRGNKFVQ